MRRAEVPDFRLDLRKPEQAEPARLQLTRSIEESLCRFGCGDSFGLETGIHEDYCASQIHIGESSGFRLLLCL